MADYFYPIGGLLLDGAIERGMTEIGFNGQTWLASDINSIMIKLAREENQ